MKRLCEVCEMIGPLVGCVVMETLVPDLPDLP